MSQYEEIFLTNDYTKLHVINRCFDKLKIDFCIFTKNGLQDQLKGVLSQFLGAAFWSFFLNAGVWFHLSCRLWCYNPEATRWETNVQGCGGAFQDEVCISVTEAKMDHSNGRVYKIICNSCLADTAADWLLLPPSQEIFELHHWSVSRVIMQQKSLKIIYSNCAKPDLSIRFKTDYWNIQQF